MPPINTYPNLNRKNKWLGIIDYKSIIVLLIYVIIIYKITSILNMSIINSIYVMLICIVPVIGVIYSNKDEEDIYQSLFIIFKFLFSCKKYLYRIDDEISDEKMLNKIEKNNKRKGIVERLAKTLNKVIFMDNKYK